MTVINCDLFIFALSRAIGRSENLERDLLKDKVLFLFLPSLGGEFYPPGPLQNQL